MKSILSILLLSVVALVLDIITPDPECIMAFLGITTGMLVAGASLLGGQLLSSGEGSKQVPRKYRDYFQRKADEFDTNAFIPDEGAFTAKAQSDVDRIMSQYGYSQEAFNADLASRGIFGSGEAPGYLAREVRAPFIREALGATTQAQKEYEYLAQSGGLGGAQIGAGKEATFAGLINPTDTARGAVGDTMSLFGTLGLLKATGIL